MSNRDRERVLESELAQAMLALRSIANYGECDYEGNHDKDKPRPCHCPHCTANHYLDPQANWRFEGGGVDRQATMPREQRIMQAFRKSMTSIVGYMDPDRALAQILYEGDTDRRGIPGQGMRLPTARDWYVASTLVQWLATNCGMEILREAGWTYTKYEEDKKLREKFRDEPVK